MKEGLPSRSGIIEKYMEKWKNGEVFAAYFSGSTSAMFPMKYDGRPAFSSLRRLNSLDLSLWYEREFASFAADASFNVEYETYKGNAIPSALSVNSPEDWLYVVGRRSAWKSAVSEAEISLKKVPELKKFFSSKAGAAAWLKADAREREDLTRAAEWYAKNKFEDSSAISVRSLRIPGCGVKFPERNKTILDLLFSSMGKAPSLNYLNPCGDVPRLRYRPLDETVSLLGFEKYTDEDVELPADVFARLFSASEASAVVLIENKTTYLELPYVPGTIAAYAAGYSGKEAGLAGLSSDSGRRLFYWGDLDPHGFSILNRFRKVLPRLTSIMMDRETYEKFINLAAPESSVNGGRRKELLPDTAEFEYLEEREKETFRGFARDPASGERFVLEQEKIDPEYAAAALARAVSERSF